MSDNIPFGYFIDITKVPDDAFSDHLLESVTRLLLREALQDAVDIADSGLTIDMDSVRAFTTLPDDLYDPREHGEEPPYGIGYHFEAYDPEDSTCAHCAA